MTITIYTDGACSGNPGIGGWGCVLIEKGEKNIYLNGGAEHTTNNQMELTAAIKSFQYFTNPKKLKYLLIANM